MIIEEKELWRAVVSQAMRDAVDRSLPSRERRAARRWFCMQLLDFLTVCDLADVDPDAVRKKALKLMKTKK